MKRSDVIPFVSAGLLAPKKRDHPLARRQLYLNYGALSLATMLDLGGQRTLLIHGDHETPDAVLERLTGMGAFPTTHPVMLSVPSFYALPWAQAFCRIVKGTDPDARIVVGGRWVVGPDVAWLRSKLPEADVLVPGLGEPTIGSLLTDQPDLRRLAAPTPAFTLNHLLVVDHLRFQPSIEASRGCGMGCKFCEERDIPLEKLREPEEIARSMALVRDQYGGSEIHPYMQASMFVPNPRWSARLAAAIYEQNLDIRWRTESRVDALLPEAIPYLAGAGLKVLDLGLETASPTQILAMKKSNNPERYLSKASALLQACSDNGVLAKVNVLLYAGESRRTLEETTQWLDAHASCIAGVSVGPVIAYGPPATADILLEEWSHTGARPVDPTSAIETGITRMHLSDEFDAEAAELASLEVSRRFMSMANYFTLKSFSYYPRDYSQSEFDRDVEASARERLPFAVDRAPVV
ncbi:B12-binding domain-containing radical SAM protein [Shinella sp. M31]|uniref:B12-binding domain-containing radical SAM protein n=1 Tax=Shinella sp. M31 TaxID=3368615 RepID=UPI003B9E0881